ncbi:MAG: phage-shock protein [Proteobacteria bacterium]|nr:phage-shock protein [Pseudomonadota bacterium]MBU4469723.1 phage-shock protein [Pseudomonadota bacterium]MCG2751804.1 phage-shock protein [Desulfobacteraceae bacterium]
MQSIWIIAVVFGSIIISLAIIPVTILFAIKLFRESGSRTKQDMDDEEAKMIQEIYQSLIKMEERVEVLETLLLDKERKDK